MDIPATGASHTLNYLRPVGAALAFGVVGVAAVVSAVAIAALVPAVSAAAGVALFPYAVVVLPVALGVAAIAAAVGLAIIFARRKPSAVVPLLPSPPQSTSQTPFPSSLLIASSTPPSLSPSRESTPPPALDLEPEGDSPSSPSPILSPMLVDSQSASAELAVHELDEVATRVIVDITEGVTRWNEALQISPTATPPLGFEQSMAVDRVDEIVKEFEEINPEDVEAYPEAVAGLGHRVLEWFHQADMTPQDASVIRVKAAKYEALLDTVNRALFDQGLPLFGAPVKQDSLEYLTQVRDLFEVEVLAALRSGGPKYDAVCHALYTANDMDQANNELINLYGLESREAGLGILERLEAVNKAVDKVGAEKTTHILNRWARSLKDKLGIRFSPIGAGNPPQKMFKLAMGDKEVTILGFGSPTIQESNISEVVIDPLFIGYLRHLKAQGKRHLYVSNQNALNEENARNRVIMALAESDEFKGTFIAITQSKNTKAYHAKNADRSIKAVQERLHGAFFEKDISKSGCGLPSSLREDKNLQKRSRYILSAIHELHFKGKDIDLSEEQERLYIELYYNLLTLLIASEMKVDNLNFTCKDGIDRGMGSLAWFIMLIEFVQGNKEKAETEEKLITTFFTRAYWTRKRNILHERFERPIEDMRTLETLDPRFTKTKAILASIAGGGVQILPHTDPSGPSAADAAAV